MKVRIRICTLAVSAILITTSSPEARASTLAQQLYEQKCGRCHIANEPTEYSVEEWPGVVRSMRAQSALNQQEYDEIVEYLVSAAAREGHGGTEKSGPVLSGYLYTEYFWTQEGAENFDIHYLALSASGWVNSRIHYFGEFELEHGGTGGSNTFVEQAYLDYWFRPNVAIRIGAMLTPFNRFDEFHGPLTNYTITRPQVSREIGVSAWKDVGVDLTGYLNLSEQASLSFDMYTLNGLGAGSRLRSSRQYRDNNEDLALGGRLNLMYRDVVEIGGSAYRGAWDSGGDHDLTLVGAHLMARTPIAEIYAEYARAESENPSPLAGGEMTGFFVQASRLFSSKVRPTIRYGRLDYLDPGDSLGRSPRDVDLSELALCVSYYPARAVALKAEYTVFLEGSRNVEKDNNQIGLQAAVRF